MTTIETTTTTIEMPRDDFVFDDAQYSPLLHSSLATAGARSRVSPRSAWLLPVGVRQRRRGVRGDASPHRVVSKRGWRTEDWRRRRSTVASRQCAASIDSPTSTDGSAPSPRSTFVAPRCTPPMRVAWIARNSVCSCSRRSSTTTTTPRSPCCLGSMGCGSAKHALPTSRILGLSEVIGRCGSSARATNRRPSRSYLALRARSIWRSASAAKVRS